jgi:hypothetical protein
VGHTQRILFYSSAVKPDTCGITVFEKRQNDFLTPSMRLFASQIANNRI